MMMLKEFYLASQRAPYLQKTETEEIKETRNLNEAEAKPALRIGSQGNLLGTRAISTTRNEADTAAGGVVTRVGSFLSIQRIQSENVTRTKSSNSFTGASLTAAVESIGSADNSSKLKSEDNTQPSENKDNKDDETNDDRKSTGKIKPDWRLRDRMRTVGVGLVMALNPGTGKIILLVL